MERIYIKQHGEIVDVGYATAVGEIDLEAKAFLYYKDPAGKFPQVLYLGNEGFIIGIATKRIVDVFKERERILIEGVEIGNIRSNAILNEQKNTYKEADKFLKSIEKIQADKKAIQSEIQEGTPGKS